MPSPLPREIAAELSPHFARFLTGPGNVDGSETPLGVAFPNSLGQIGSLVRWANEVNCSLRVTSSSRDAELPHARAKARTGLHVDLSRMNRILHVDDRDSMAIIEAGVTFPQLDAALGGHGLRSFKPLLPSRRKSVLASHLDREPTTSPHDHWDSQDPLGGAEMVFGNGEGYRTGTAAVKGSLQKQLKRGALPMMALGPASTDFLRVVQGSRGTLAIVGWASIFCEPIPALESAWFVGSRELEPLVELAYKLLWRRTGGQTFIVNGTQFGMIGGKDPSSCAALAADAPPWVLYVNLVSPDYLARERMAYLEADLVADAEMLDLRLVGKIAGLAADSIGMQQSNLPQYPYKNRWAGAYRELFCLTQMDRVRDLLDAAALDPGASVGVYLQPRVQGTSCHFELVFPFDPRSQDAAEHAERTIDETAARLDAAGAFFSRPHGSWGRLAFERDTAIGPYLNAAKDMMDPARILNPGTFCF